MLIAEGQGPKRKKATVTNDNVAVVHDLIRTYVASMFHKQVSGIVQVCPWAIRFSDIFFFAFEDVLFKVCTSLRLLKSVHEITFCIVLHLPS